MRVEPQQVRQFIERIIAPLGYELVDLRYLTDQGRRLLRVLVDREGGVTVGDCERISREIETPLEVEGLIPERYDLEVSSPGLNRPLVKEADFIRFIGRKIYVMSREPIDGRRNFKGTLQGVNTGNILMMIDGKEYRIPEREVEKAHLIFEGGK